MSTPKPNSQIENALQAVPTIFRSKLIGAYESLKRTHVEGRFEASGLAAGKFCEIAIRLCQNIVFGQYTPFGKKIDNFAEECRKLVSSSSSVATDSIRIVVPRALLFMYTMRNKRGIGHVGGDVEANSIDSATLARSADWVICELIRIFHGLSLEEAQDLVDSLATRSIPEIWSVGDKRRILRSDLNATQQTLLLIYSDPNSYVLAEDLCGWIEYAQLSMYKRNVLRPMHKKRLIEFDDEAGLVHISPLGVAAVEKTILKQSIT